MEDKKLTVLILSLVPFLMVLGNSMLIPEFPTLKSQLHINQFQVGLLITYFSAPAAVAIPFLGYLSDRVGRKIIIIPAVILYGLGGVIAGLASVWIKNPYSIILGSRIIQGVGAAGTGPIAMALAGDLFKTGERSESMGILEAANGMGKVLSPIIGSAVALIVWYALFFSYAALSVPVAILVWLFVKEGEQTGKQQPFKEYLKSMSIIFERKGVSLLMNFLGGLVVLFILFGVLSLISDILEQVFHLKGIARGAILSVPLLAMSVTAYLAGIFLRNKDKYYKLFYVSGLVIVALSMALLPFCCRHHIACPVVLGVMGLGSGLVLPAVNTMVTSSTQSEQRGGVTSLYGSVRFIGVALGPPTFSLLQGCGDFLMYYSVGGVALAASIAGFFFINEKAIMKTSQNQPSENPS